MVQVLTIVGSGLVATHRFAVAIGMGFFRGAIIVTGYSILMGAIEGISSYLGGKAAKWLTKHPRIESALSKPILLMRKAKSKLPTAREFVNLPGRAATQVVRPFSWMKKKLIALW